MKKQIARTQFQALDRLRESAIAANALLDDAYSEAKEILGASGEEAECDHIADFIFGSSAASPLSTMGVLNILGISPEADEPSQPDQQMTGEQ